MATNNVERRAEVPGAVLFARYAYPPNSLGYCGPGDPTALLESAVDGGHVDHLTHLAAQFDGAWPYLELIAACNGIDDPLDRRVVEAYWIGNQFALRVPPSILAASLDERFARRSNGRITDVVAPVIAGAVAQHGLHVFGVYPWVGLLRAGKEGPAMEVIDRCRIRWGRVVALGEEMIRVVSQPMRFDGSALALGQEREELVRRSVDGAGFVDGLRVGEVVSMHWDWVCDRLSARDLQWLTYCTERNLRAVNSLSVRGPAAACGT
jgi:hypothetical protein